MRLCFFGGTFDPPHRGHLAVARAAAAAHALDRVLLVPAAVPPHKRGAPVTDFAHRLAMLQLAVTSAGDPHLEASDIESPAPTAGAPNYSVDTLRALRRKLASADQLFFLLGADSFQSFGKWHEPEAIAAMCEFIVCNRPGYDLNACIAALPPALMAQVRLHRIDTTLEDVSATAVRDSIHQHGQLAAGVLNGVLDDLVTPAVAAYIRRHHLYE